MLDVQRCPLLSMFSGADLCVQRCHLLSMKRCTSSSCTAIALWADLFGVYRAYRCTISFSVRISLSLQNGDRYCNSGSSMFVQLLPAGRPFSGTSKISLYIGLSLDARLIDLCPAFIDLVGKSGHVED